MLDGLSSFKDLFLQYFAGSRAGSKDEELLSIGVDRFCRFLHQRGLACPRSARDRRNSVS